MRQGRTRYATDDRLLAQPVGGEGGKETTVSDDEEDCNPVFKMTPIRTIEYVLVPKNEYDELVAELARLRGQGSATVDTDNQSVRAAQNGCSALEQGAVCGERTYADHAYCPKHQQRFARTGDPCLARKRGPKKEERLK